MSSRVALIGMGEVGQILATDLHRAGVAEISAWDRLFAVPDSAPARAVQSLEFVREAKSPADAIAACQVVISAVTAAECASAAHEAARSLTPGTYYFDLNSVSPETKTQAAEIIAAAGGRYVEGAVMSPIGPKRIGSPIWLGGPHAKPFQVVGGQLGFSGAAVYSDTFGAASAAKMCRSVLVKGLEALLTESLLTARHHGVEQTVLESLDDLLPSSDWRALAQYMISRSLQHGARRAAEMREAARTVAHAGIEPWMSDGCVRRQHWAAQRAGALAGGSLEGMLDKILNQGRGTEDEPGAPLAAGTHVS